MSNCAEVKKKNFSRSTCNKLPALPIGMITTIQGLVIPKETLADQSALKTFLNAAILAKQAWYWPNFSTFENIPKEAAYEDTSLAYLNTDDGQYRFRFGISENICMHKAMYTHRAISGRVILVDKENQLLLTENSDGDGMGLDIQLLNTEKFIFNDGSVSTKSPILVALRNNKEIDKNGILVTLDSYNELYRITDVAITPGLNSNATMLVTVGAECDETEVIGLALGDFIYKNLAGNVVTITTYTDHGDGTYTLNQSGNLFVNGGTLELKTPANLSIKPYELPEPVVVEFAS